jgi:hypothetical protein
VALMQAITPENLRAEMYRHQLTRAAICALIGMHPNALSMYLNGVRPLSGWAAHNIGWAMNTTTGLMLFDIDMAIGPIEPPRGRPSAVKLFAPKKKKRRYVKLADSPPTRHLLTGRF